MNYVGVFKDDLLVGVAIIQRVELYLKDVFRNETDSRLLETFKQGISKLLKGNLLVVGNLTHTGQHGLYFNAEKISQKDFLNEVFQAVFQLKKDIKTTHNKRIRMIMLKDFFQDDALQQETNLFNKYKIF